jgi:hypothetical protein
MGILGRLFGDDSTKTEGVDQAVERVTALYPLLRLARRCQPRLKPAIATSIRHVSELVASFPAPHEASTHGWSSDPCIHAFFASPENLLRAFSRSEDLREYFERNAGAHEAYAVLGMAMIERHVLGAELVGETMRRDVVQTTVSFDDHRVRICGNSDHDLRQEIVRRMIDQLALEGLNKIAADQNRRDMLEKERALLKTRLQLLGRQGTGINAMFSGDATVESQEVARLQVQIDENTRNLDALGNQAEGLERKLDCICEVMMEPEQYIYVIKKQLRLDRMNVVRASGSAHACEDIVFHIAHVPAMQQMRAFALVRFPRSELLPAGYLLDQAIRELSAVH